MDKIAERIEVVKDRIADSCARVGRDPGEVKLVVVTKSASFDAVREVIRLGCSDLGESRVQHLKKVSAQVEEFLASGGEGAAGRVNWHMVGHLQRNKVRQVLGTCSLIHSVDTLRLAEEISAASSKMGIVGRVLLQVNTSNEPQKYGVPVGAATHLAEQIDTLHGLQLVGIMTMAPLTHNQDVIRSCFIRAHELFVEIKGERIVGPAFRELSMGMSNDYETAVESGSTILRVGSAVFA
jgi:pyridoxal phosphate enzyme (YggS family)